jgi:hypothetical protein
MMLRVFLLSEDPTLYPTAEHFMAWQEVASYPEECDVLVIDRSILTDEEAGEFAKVLSSEPRFSLMMLVLIGESIEPFRNPIAGLIRHSCKPESIRRILAEMLQIPWMA